MRLALAILLASFTLFGAEVWSAPAATYVIRGIPLIPKKSNSGTFILRTFDHLYGRPERDFVIPFSALTPVEFKNVLVADKNASFIDLNVQESDVKVGPAMGLLSDCAETKLDFKTIKEIASRPSVTSSLDLIRALPAGTLQTYTYVYDSYSLQNQRDLPEDIRPLWPRVLRMSEDGKIIMAYTCNPASKDYNTVEVMNFDEDANFNFNLIDFRKNRTGIAIPAEHRLSRPQTCAGCHTDPNLKSPVSAASDFRPNIPNYKVWKGWYGSHNDNLMDPDSPQITYLWQGKDKTASEDVAFADFKNARRGNPCYGTLPKPAHRSSAYDLYPYIAAADTDYDLQLHFEYHLRPNFKFSEVESRLMALHIFKKLMTDERARKVRTLLAMEDLGGCGLNLSQEIAKWIPGYVVPSPITVLPAKDAHFDPRTLESRAMNLYQVGKIIGLQNFDWSMNLGTRSPFYNTGITADHSSQDPPAKLALAKDTAISAVVQSEIMKSLVKEDSSLGQWLAKPHGVEQIFGERFACIDDIAAEIFVRSASDHASLCEALVKRYNSGADL